MTRADKIMILIRKGEWIMNKIKLFIQKHRESYDRLIQNRKIKKLSKAIWKYALKDSIDPVYTKEDAFTLSIAIHWNDAEDAKKVLSYKDENGNRIFPR